MMHQHNPFYDFEAVKPEPPTGSRARWIILGVIFVVALVVTALLGYGLGSHTLAIPGPLAARIPAPFSRWLAFPHAQSGPTVLPGELKDYGFELVGAQVKQGDAVLSVRLVNKSSGKLVPDAIVFARRLDMAPEGMPTMKTTLEPEPATEPGVYRFKTNLTMEGGWRLSLAAKVQGEIGTVQNKLVLKAVP